MPWGTGPEAPVPAPQTPHLLPSSLFPPENHWCPDPVPRRLSHTSAPAMRDITFFSRLLALDHPWRVRRVSLDTHRHRIDLGLVHRRNASFACPECGQPAPLRDHAATRSWRHLDHGGCSTWLHANLPRVACPAHGVRRVRVPWALPGSRFTIAFERHAIDVLLETDVLGGARLLHVSWDEAWNIMERAVARGMRAKRRRVIAHLGVDEKAVAKRHRYVTLVCDLDRSTVEYIADDRKQASLDAYYLSLSPRQLAGIQAVAMDMWDPFIASTVAHVPDGESKIVFDRFHVMKHMLEAVDEVRKREHGLLKAEGDETLKGTKYLWLFSEENLPEPSRERFAALRGAAPEDRSGVGDQGIAARPVGLPAQGVGVATLEALVLLGDPFALEARRRGGPDDRKAPGQRPDVFRPSDHQRHERGAELEDPDG